MSRYLRKYNENTGKWEIISPTSSDDISVTNTGYNSGDNSISTLTDVLNGIGSDINTLKRNVSWLAEHGGGGGGIGVGGGNITNYKIMVMNAGIVNDTLYVNQSKFSVTFKVTGGSVSDTIEYRIVYDGNYINNAFTKVKVNTNVTISIDDIEMFSKVTPHTLVIEAIDADGMTIPPYTLSVVEASVKVECPLSNILTIGQEGKFDIFVTNKILNVTTSVKIINTSFDNKEYNYSYVSTTTATTPIPIDFYKYLVDEALVAVGNTYSLKIEVQTTTSEGTPINGAPIYTTISIIGSNEIVINLQSITSENDYDADVPNGSEFAAGGNLNFGFTPYLIDNLTIYYAVQLQSADNEDIKEDIAGYFDLYDYENNEEKKYSDNLTMLTGKLKTISWYIPNDGRFIGEWLVKVKCWSSTGLISKEAIGKCRINNANTEVFPPQIPTRGNFTTGGNTQYAYWDITSMESNPKSKTWKSEIFTYLPPGSSEESDVVSVNTIMNIYGTNGEQNGFLTSPNRLRLSSEAYATIDTDINETWYEQDGFTISLTFQSDLHPYNDRTIFFLGNIDANDEFYNGLKIDLENVYWYFNSESSDGKKVSNRMVVPIKQNVLNTVDFVYIHKKKSDGTNEGMAKIFINGKLYRAVEADNYTSVLPNRIYLGCAYSAAKDKLFNYADVDITSLRIFSKYLNDMEVVVNSHNARAERDENGNINGEAYIEWKKRNYFIDNENNIPNSSIYKLVENDYQYTCPGFSGMMSSTPPLPVMWLDGSGSNFLREIYESTNFTSDITKEKFTGFQMFYYDPNANDGKGKEVQAEVAVSIQGTSTTTLRSKNLEIYFTKELDGYTDGRTQLFQPREDWFPESQFTLKADVVDSSHANNATLGRWINTEAARTILEDTPPMVAVKNNPPKDVVKGSNGNNIVYENKHTSPTVKHTLEGFQIILMITFGNETKPEMLGVYSFNLGRYSYYNMGLSFFKSFSRRIYNEITTEWEDVSAPALINHYDFYERTEVYEGINLDEVFSFEFGSDADENNIEYNTWSQDDLSILKHIGSFRFNGINGDDSIPADKAWLALQRLFYATARMPMVSNIYTYNGTAYVTKGESYTEDLNVASEFLVKRLSIKNAVAYYVIANAFGMVDSLGKNLTLRSWNARYTDSSDDVKDINMWYPCFYDMDTALGLTNAGDENVQPTVYMDSYSNKEISEEAMSPNILVIERNKQQENGFGAYNSKLWNILRSTAENGDPSKFVSSGKWTGALYEGTWRTLRQENSPLSSPDLFIDMFTRQTKDCGELLYNLDYNVKYLTKYLNNQTNVESYGNIEMLHGDRVEYIRQWLRDRLYYLDGIFEVNNVVDGRLPYYTNGYITCGGPEGGGHPRVTFNATSPTILTVEIGQNGQTYKYFLPSYEDTEIIMPPLSSDSKRIGINSTTLLTKIEGLKDNRFQKFEGMSLPKFSQIDLSGVKTLTSDNPVNFEEVFVTSDNGRITSDIREINLYNATGTNSFPVTINDYDKVKRIDIRNSCVTSMSLPSAPLSSLLFSNSEVVELEIKSQPYLESLDFTGCKKLQKVTLYDCNNLTTLNLAGLNLLSELSIAECDNVVKIDCSNNKELQTVTIEGLSNLKEVNLSGCTNTSLSISIKNCNALTTINLRDIVTRNAIVLPTDVSNVTKLVIEGCTNLTGFKYGDTNSAVDKYNGEDVLDLRPFTSLTGNGLQMKRCSNLKYVKFDNNKDKAFVLSSSFFDGCSTLVNVFGHMAINGTGVFDGCGNFFIYELPDATITPMPAEDKFFETTESNNGNITNITVNTTNLSNCFRNTKCNLYDVYYILQKCDNVENLTNAFYGCAEIKSNDVNCLNTAIFKHCGKVTNMTQLFWGTGISGVLKSPKIVNGSITEDGILSNCYSLTTFNHVFPYSSCSIDENFFFKTNKGTNLPITNISYFSPKIVANSHDEVLTNGYASSSVLLKYLPSLTTLYEAFNSSRYTFNDKNYVTLDGKAYYYTDLFYNNTKLSSIKISFKNITGSGVLRNLFGGYKGTLSDTTHFPQSLSAVCDSFIISGGDVAMYVGDSFLQKIKNSIVYITGVQAGSNTTTSSSSFTGSGLKKYIDKEDNDSVVAFPYKVFNGCSKLKEAPAFFKELRRTDEYNGTITLPTYEDDYGNIKSIFNDTLNLTNASYMFAEMHNIKYKLTSGGFKKCSLVNASYIFAELESNNLTTGNKTGMIPYGLFLQEKTASYKTVSGLTKEEALDLGITDETYGIKDCVFDGDGKVIVKFDEEGKVISGSTYADGTIIQYEIDEYGKIQEGVTPEKIYPQPQALTTHKGNYTTHNATIKQMDGFMQYSSSQDMEAYRCNVTREVMTYDSNTGVYGCPELILDNENYNPIMYYINDAFDPRLFVWDENTKQDVQNPSYDPRRVILNKNYDTYKKKWNKWFADGTSSFIEEILASDLYKSIEDGTNTELPSVLPEEMQVDYISDEVALSSDMNYTNDRFNTRSYLCSPDLFRYCTPDASIIRSFYYCSGPDTAREGYEDDDYIRYGLYGVIPPYLFEPIYNTTSLEDVFWHFKGVLPYKWATTDNTGLMYSPELFTKLTKLKNIRGLFALNVMYNRCNISGTQFSTNKELTNTSYLFYNTIWGTSQLGQVENTLFNNNKNITDVSYMFYTSDSYGNGRLPRVMSSDLFTPSNNPKINNCSYFMHNGQKTSGSVPEFWTWPPATMRTTTGCYRNINAEDITNYSSIPDSYK